MLTITEAAESSSRLLSIELLETAARLDDAACIAQAIAQRMDPEWREFVDQEQRRAAQAQERFVKPFRTLNRSCRSSFRHKPTEAIVSNRL